MITRAGIFCAFSASLFFFAFSLLVFPYYQEGDQQFYRAFYDGTQGLSFADAFVFYQGTLGTFEPLYFIFSYSVSAFLTKDTALSIVNALFAFLLFKRLLEYRTHPIVIGLISLNFYFLVLLFSAERLKLSLLFFLLAAGNTGLTRYSWLLASVLAHLQTLVLLCAIHTRRLLSAARRLLNGFVGVDLVALVLTGVGMSIVLVVMYGHISMKAAHYYETQGGIEGALKPAIFALLSIWYASRKTEALISSSLIVILSLFFGSERLAIFGYFIFMHYSLSINRGLNVATIITSAYFAVKGIFFLENVFLTGDGFAT